MITIKYSDNLITIKGHAGYDETGKDIVCASVSSIINVIVNSCLTINPESIKYEDDGNIVRIEKLSNDDITNTLLNVLVSSLNDLSNKYPTNIELKEEK